MILIDNLYLIIFWLIPTYGHADPPPLSEVSPLKK